MLRRNFREFGWINYFSDIRGNSKVEIFFGSVIIRLLWINDKTGAMSVRGIRQLRELTIKYSDIDGSSRGIREWMNTHLLKFAKENPTLLIRTERKRNQHPFLRGHYLNGNSKTIGIKNQSVEQIHDYVFHLRNQIGRRVRVSALFPYLLLYLPLLFVLDE